MNCFQSKDIQMKWIILTLMFSPLAYGKCDLTENSNQPGCAKELSAYKDNLKAAVRIYKKGVYLTSKPQVIDISTLKTMGVKTRFSHVLSWELHQIKNGWALYVNKELPEKKSFLVGVNLKSIEKLEKNKLSRTERLFTRFQFLGKTGKSTAETQLGFDIPIILFDAIYPTPL